MAALGERLAHAWNAFRRPPKAPSTGGSIINYSPGRIGYATGPDKSTLASIRNRIAMDCAAIQIHHVRNDNNGRFEKRITDGLDFCLNVEANVDQAARMFRQDIFLSLLEKGTAAIVPVETDLDPSTSETYEIKDMRVGEVVEWYPRNVKVKVFNDQRGEVEEVILPKRLCAIVESPLYTVMNAPNSTFQRLMRKLTLLDQADEAASANKLDIIIQLPYVIKSEARRQEAERRRTQIEQQLTGAKYGVAYTDGTERITQLNRPAENTLLTQIEYLTKRLYTELGLTEEVLNGTADEHAMLNYSARTIKPMVDAVVEELSRKFLTKAARTRGHALQTYTDPFALVPISQIADIADKLTRNEVLSPNELRSIIGFKPVQDPAADELRNRNLVLEDTQPVEATTG